MNDNNNPNPSTPVEDPDTTDYKAKAEEFRANNRALHKKAQDLENRYKHVDLDEYDRMKTGKTTAQNAEALEIERRYKGELEVERAARTAAESSLRTRILDGELSRQANSLGVRPEALEDFLARGQRIFDVADNRVVSRGQDGVTVDEWTKELKKKAPHLFAASTGGSSQGSRGAQGGGRMQLTAKQAAQPTVAQMKAIQSGEVDYLD